MPQHPPLEVFLFPINPDPADTSSWEHNVAATLNAHNIQEVVAAFPIYPLLVAAEPHKPFIMMIARPYSEDP